MPKNLFLQNGNEFAEIFAFQTPENIVESWLTNAVDSTKLMRIKLVFMS